MRKGIPVLPAWMSDLPFRIGTTSYIIPDDILPNARFLAGRVRDIELVIFELDDGVNNLPGLEVLTELARLASQVSLSYTVHLPLDLHLGADGDEQSLSLVKAKRVIQTTRPLEPWAYVLHLDGSQPGDHQEPTGRTTWQEQAVRALEIVSEWAGDPSHLAVENLDGYPPEFNDPVLERLPVSRCVDIGHLWKDGSDPGAYLMSSLPRTRVVHLHGIQQRDHQSLAHVPTSQLDEVLHGLLFAPFTGVVTLEIFNQEDLASSLQALQDSLRRLGAV